MTERSVGEWKKLVVATFVATFVVHLPGFFLRLFDPDEAAIAAVAITRRSGGTIYVDALDRKPPVPALLYEGVFGVTGSVDLRPVRVVVAVLIACAALIVATDVRRRHGDRAAWWAAGLFVFGSVAFFPQDAQAANFAQIALLPGAAAVVTSSCRRRWAPLVAGVALGVAILSRQSWLVGVVPALLGVVFSAPPNWRRRVEAVVGFAVGLVASVASIGLVVPFSDFWRWTFTNNSGFVSAGAEAGPTFARFGATVATFVGFHLVLVIGLAVLGRRQLGDIPGLWRDPHESDLARWLWLLTGCASVVAGFRFFGHYWLQVLPPLVLLAAPVAAEAKPKWAKLGALSVALPAVFVFTVAWSPSLFRELPKRDLLVAYVQANTAPNEPVWVWGSLPELYLDADRPIGGALVHSDFVTGRSGGRASGTQTLEDATPGALDALLTSLRANPPALVLDTSTANIRDYGLYPVSTFPELEEWLTAGYSKVAVVDGVTVWAPK